jgi:prevent-host-death family protein
VAKVTPVPVETLRDNLAEHVRQAESGARLVVTFHGKAVAGLVPVSDLERVAGKVDLPKRPKPDRK